MANRLGARKVRLRIVTTARQIALRWLAGRIPLWYVPRRCERTSVSVHRAGNDRSRRRGAGATRCREAASVAPKRSKECGLVNDNPGCGKPSFAPDSARVSDRAASTHRGRKDTSRWISEPEMSAAPNGTHHDQG
jgi:hypothetical protein